MTARPLVGVYSSAKKADEYVRLPAVFSAPIRSDIVQEVHMNLNKNKRQPYAVSRYAGHQSSAESWGTGRAVSRIPRVPGGGTHRSGQGAFGNMCRGGRMFAPTRVWRRWHRRVNVNQRRTAAAAALAASALPALVMARGHRVERIAEVPLVVSSKTLASIDKTSKAVTLLKGLNAYDDIERVIESKKIRVGAGKARNRRYVQRTGPLVVYSDKGPFLKAFRNIPGIDLVNVAKLSVLDLAPGGHLGRFIIYTKDAFQALDNQFGTYKTASSVKKGFQLPKPLLTNADLGRIINSEEVQTHLREKRSTRRIVRKKNPYRNFQFLVKLNPYAKTLKRQRLVSAMRAQKAKESIAEAKRKGVKTDKKKKVKQVRAKAFAKSLFA